MELRGCQDAVILVLDAQDVEGRFQSFDQIRAGGASVTCEDNLGWAFVDLADFIDKRLIQDLLISVCELVIRGVREYRSMRLP